MIPVSPTKALRGSLRVPSSKPHCQRALILATLAEGVSEIHHMHTCSETQVIAEACQAFGATLQWQNESLQIRGVGGRLRQPRCVIRLAGSGFALRTILAMASLVDGPTILMGDEKLGQRPHQPLIDQLTRQGASIEPLEPFQTLPLVNWGGGLSGGTVTLPVETTSQFVTALMLVAPYATETVVLRLENEVVGKEYIQMNQALMEAFGANVRISEDLREIRIRRGGYVAHTMSVGPDVTSLFCFIAAAVIVDTDIHIESVSLGADSLLDEAMAIGRTLGVQVYQTSSGVRILSGKLPTSLVEFHVTHVPTLVPALTAIAGYLPHGMRLTGAQHIRFHKTSRLETLMAELEKLSFSFQPIYKGNVVDGFEASLGSGNRVCVEPLDSHGDHRLFMALFLASLPLAEPEHILGAETLVASFPEFVACFRALGVSDAYLQISSTTNVRK